MLTELKEMIVRAEATLLQDALGAAALMVMLLASLHVPAFV